MRILVPFQSVIYRAPKGSTGSKLNISNSRFLLGVSFLISVEKKFTFYSIPDVPTILQFHREEYQT